MLTPIDIENKEFAKSFRGYDSIEVDEFMRSLVTDYESLYRENASLKEKYAVLSETLDNYKGMEGTMQNAILVAQKTAEDIKQHAYERANTITQEAESKAGNIITAAEKRAQELEKEYSSLKKEMNTFKARMSSLLHTYLRLIEETAQKEDALKGNNNPADSSKASSAESENNVNGHAPVNEEQKEESYTPKKVNPLVDELLKQRNAASSAQSSKAPAEMIVNISNDKNKQYDVFSDESF